MSVRGSNFGPLVRGVLLGAATAALVAVGWPGSDRTQLAGADSDTVGGTRGSDGADGQDASSSCLYPFLSSDSATACTTVGQDGADGQPGFDQRGQP